MRFAHAKRSYRRSCCCALCAYEPFFFETKYYYAHFNNFGVLARLSTGIPILMHIIVNAIHIIRKCAHRNVIGKHGRELLYLANTPLSRGGGVARRAGGGCSIRWRAPRSHFTGRGVSPEPYHPGRAIITTGYTPKIYCYGPAYVCY